MYKLDFSFYVLSFRGRMFYFLTIVMCLCTFVRCTSFINIYIYIYIICYRRRALLNLWHLLVTSSIRNLLLILHFAFMSLYVGRFIDLTKKVITYDVVFKETNIFRHVLNYFQQFHTNTKNYKNIKQESTTRRKKNSVDHLICTTTNITR